MSEHEGSHEGEKREAHSAAIEAGDGVADHDVKDDDQFSAIPSEAAPVDNAQMDANESQTDAKARADDKESEEIESTHLDSDNDESKSSQTYNASGELENEHEQPTPNIPHDTALRPTSLPSPETPSKNTHALTDDDALLKQQETPRLSSHGSWRDSVATTSALDSVALTDTSSIASPPTSPISASDFSFVALAGVVEQATTNGHNVPSLALPEDDTASRSEQPSPSGVSSHDYDFLRHRADSTSVAMAEHLANGQRRSQIVDQEIRASFNRMKEDAQHYASEHDDSTVSAKDLGTSNDYANGIQAIDWDLWGNIMNDYEGMARNSPRQLSKAIQNGIPPALRGMMWQLMSASKDPELETVYSQLMKQNSPHEKQIVRDLNRTFPSHEYFKTGSGVGQGNLMNVVKAYSLYDEEVGYCQGMAFVVGPLLLNMPDEEAFCVLVRLMKSYDLRSQYLPDMPGLQLRLFQFDRLLEELLPATFLHLLRQGIKSSMYASQWFLTLLAYRFPLELVCSVFDLIFAEGVEAIFRFAIALMKRNEARLLELDFEHLLEFLKSGLFEHYKLDLEKEAGDADSDTYCARTFLREALFVKITPLMLDQFANEWTEMCRQQTAQSREVEQLREINRKLSNQVRGLEHSLAQINQEHCDLVKQVVQIRLDKEELEDELVKCKMALAQESLLREEGRGSRGSVSSFVSSSSMLSGRTNSEGVS